MSADIDHRPAQRRRTSSPEIQVTRQIIGGREVITLEDSDDEIQPVRALRPQAAARRARNHHPSHNGRTRFEELRRREQEGEAFAHRHLMQAAIGQGDLDLEIAPEEAQRDREDEDGDYVPEQDRIFSPTPPPARNAANRRVIGLGGALFVQDGLQINFNLGERVNRYLAALPIMGFGENRDLLAHAAPPAIPAYNTEYTHPNPAGQRGSAHSFPASPPSPDRKGKSVHPRASINFQCAECHDNLYLAAPDSKRRVYALRCGHLLDGQCVRKLSTPPRGLYPQTEDIPVLDVESPIRKGRGRGRGARGAIKAKPSNRKRKRVEEPKLAWDWKCPTCQHVHVSEWDAAAGEGQKGAWTPHQENGAILLYL